MSTKVNTGWLNDNNGVKFAPKTLLSQVITNDGSTLEDKLETDLDNIESNLLEQFNTLTEAVAGHTHSFNDLEDKPFGEEIAMQELVYEQSFEYTPQTYLDGEPFRDESEVAEQIGKIYIVTLNGIEYRCETWTNMSSIWGAPNIFYIGNSQVLNSGDEFDNYHPSGEPFMINVNSTYVDGLGDEVFNGCDWTLWLKDGVEGSTHTIKVDAVVGETVKTLDDKYIPDTIARVSDISTFSGAWNDLTDKPFGEEEITVTKAITDGEVYVEWQPANEDFGYVCETTDAPVLGDTYIITLNGDSYECVAYIPENEEDGYCAYIGNGGYYWYEGNGEDVPFLVTVIFNDFYGKYTWSMRDSGDAMFGFRNFTTKIEHVTVGETVKKLDSKYLPDSAGGNGIVDIIFYKKYDAVDEAYNTTVEINDVVFESDDIAYYTEEDPYGEVYSHARVTQEVLEAMFDVMETKPCRFVKKEETEDGMNYAFSSAYNFTRAYNSCYVYNFIDGVGTEISVPEP